MTDPGGRHALPAGSGETGGDNLPALSDSAAVTLPSAGLSPRVGGPGPVDQTRAPSGYPARRHARVGRPARRPDWLLEQLPVDMLRADFFRRFVSIFQDMAGTLLDGADLIDHVVDPTVTPTPMVGHLASWIGVHTVDASLPDHLQRLILAGSAKALGRRGTPLGLRDFLEMLSGSRADVDDGGGIWPEGEVPGDTAWVVLRVQGTGHLSEDEFVGLVRDEIPAHVRAELWVGDKRVLSTAEEPE